ncbi:hypothetical protein [Breoghania sp.]|uniref:hypothetical protein n=1 Tax=Breoghania sp. TaxID=2065378 RepID=UPI0029C9F6E0|nr:hypothetical protein [Breoghania sp.]
MKSINKHGWTYGELALAVGMRALGEDPETIAGMLNRERIEVIRVLAVARGLIVTEGWPALLLRDQAEIERCLRRVRPNVAERVEPFQVRNFSVAKIINPPEHGPDVTARRLGDPTPEQRERIAELQAREAGPARPPHYY